MYLYMYIYYYYYHIRHLLYASDCRKLVRTSFLCLVWMREIILDSNTV